MSSKTLTATLKFNTSQAENALKRVNKQITNINKVLNKTKATNLEKQLSRAGTQATELRTKIGKVNSALSKTASTGSKVSSNLAKATTKVSKLKNAQNQVTHSARATNAQYRQSNHLLGSMGSKLKMLASTYLGVMGAKAMVGTSDTITKAQNKLNNLNGGDTELTQQQMDKMYASANKVRMGYTDMLSNASKSMVLAGDAFQGNMDNAIRFQEIMAESYALGGASAEEMSTSMYQMIQALGSGTLAGDELRSVREGAPLAYKAIEEYVQGVMAQSDATKKYATQSLKDIASAGLVTSEMVTAAIMDSGKTIDEQFGKTAMTFEQAWDRIKNSAVKAFEPVSNTLNKMLNQAAENGAFEKIEQAFWNISKVLQIVFQLIYNAVVWIADNWNWLKHIVVGALILIGVYLVATGAIAVYTAIKTALAWIAANWVLLLIVASLALIIYGFYLVTQGALTMTEFLVWCATVIAIAFLIAGIIMGSVPMLIIALVFLLLAVVFYFFEQVCYGAGWLAAWIVNIVLFIVNCIITYVYLYLTFWWNVIALIVNSVMAVAMAIGTIVQWIVAFIVNLAMGVANSIVAISHNCVATVINVATALWNSISAICQNIGIAFQNAWNGALSAFWNFIADCVEGLNWLAKPLEAIAELFGKSFDAGSFAGDIRSKANSYKQKDYVSVSNAWSSGMNSVEYKDVGDAWSSGWNTMQFANMGDMISSGWNTMDFASFGDAFNSGMGTLDYVDANQWGTTAGNWGAGVTDSINKWGSKFQTGGSNGKSGASDMSSMLDNIGKELGLDFGDMTGTGGSGGFPNANNPAYDTTGAYKSPTPEDLINNALGKDVGDIADNTGSIKDSMDLAEEDLEYLRKLAAMEWKKEYTTANITVDMSNYNTINGDNDLDGIVTKLSDKLKEELNVLADGVYA